MELIVRSGWKFSVNAVDIAIEQGYSERLTQGSRLKPTMSDDIGCAVSNWQTAVSLLELIAFYHVDQVHATEP